MHKIGQYINLVGAKATLRALFVDRSLFVPDIRVESVDKIKWANLQAEGRIKYLVFDKDNTLTVPYS